jgi:hypothetical protein
MYAAAFGMRARERGTKQAWLCSAVAVREIRARIFTGAMNF